MSPVQDKLTINPKDATMLLIDRRSGLFNLVNDIPLVDLCRNIAALAQVATLLKIPLIATGPVADNPNARGTTGQLTDGPC